MSTQIRITVDGCSPGSGGQPGTGSPPAAGGQPLPNALQVAQPLSSFPQSVTDGDGNESGLQLATTPGPVNVTTDLTVDGMATLSGGAAVTEGLTADTVTINSQGMSPPPPFAATVTGGLSADTATITNDATINGQLKVGSVAVTGLAAGSANVAGTTTLQGAATLSGGATVAGGLTADTVTISGLGGSPPQTPAASVTGGLTADTANVGQLTVTNAMQTFSWQPLRGIWEPTSPNPSSTAQTIMQTYPNATYVASIQPLTDGFLLLVATATYDNASLVPNTITIGPSQVLDGTPDQLMIIPPTATVDTTGTVLYPVQKGVIYWITSQGTNGVDIGFWGMGNAGV